MLIKALAAAAGNFGVAGYDIDNSLRFNDNDSAYLSRTPSVAGNRKTWTWSGWVKRGNVGGQFLTAGATSISNGLSTIGTYADSAYVVFYSSASHVYTSPALFRDSSGWYHIVFSIDTTQSTASERVKFYVNGVRFDLNVLGGYTAVPQNFDCSVNNSGQSHVIGTGRNSSGSLALFFDGYMAEINFIDGQALTPASFGEIDATTGEWSPKAYSGTYGTNGFYLPFNGNANDDSGNGNNWTENNLASTDYMIDTPTNNFSVLNPNANSGLTLSEGNLKFTSDISNRDTTLATMGVTSGKWYWELLVVDDAIMVGIEKDSHYPIADSRTGLDTDGYAWRIDSNVLYHDSSSEGSYGASVSPNDIVGVAFDLDAGTIEYFINNVSQGQAFSGITGGWVPSVSDSANVQAADGTLNFGADSSFAGLKTRQGNTDANGKGDFYYTPPTGGYLALCTDNLPAPAIEQPETQFNVVTYTGDGTTPQAITGVGFQPDLVWIKRRDSATDNTVLDSLRGDARLETNNTNAELGGNINVFSSFDSDGFTTGFSSQTGASGGSYVAWCWKAGGTAVTNTDGTITSQVSANVDAGFSIVKYTTTGATTVGHGLTSTPQLIITKQYDSTSQWPVQVNYVDSTSYYLYLNTTSASVGAFGATADNTVFSPITTTSGRNYIAYLFSSVEGFSKIGTYVGNGSADGPFVYTGFKPAFVMIKRTDSTANWNIWDKERSDYNPANDLLQPDSNAAEYVNLTAWDIDLVSNGFKVRGTNQQVNASGGTYIYMAFAEAPFKEALAR